MTSDNVSRSEAKEAITTPLNFHQDRLEKLRMRETCDPSHVDHAEGVVNGFELALAAIDALPAAGEEREGQFQTAWRELYNWLWDAPEVKSASRVIDLMGRIEQRRELPEDISAPAPAEREPERPEKPPMLLAAISNSLDHDREMWWLRRGVSWRNATDFSAATSGLFTSVDRTASDQAALAIYDNDLI